jgi:hypothetical protein
MLRLVARQRLTKYNNSIQDNYIEEKTMTHKTVQNITKLWWCKGCTFGWGLLLAGRTCRGFIWLGLGEGSGWCLKLALDDVWMVFYLGLVTAALSSAHFFKTPNNPKEIGRGLRAFFDRGD